MNNLDLAYSALVSKILMEGEVRDDRTGTGTVSIFGQTLTHDMKEGFPLITSKFVSFKNVAIELLWFLKGDTNIKYLIDNGCNIWNDDTHKYYLRRYCDDSKRPKISKEDFIKDLKNGSLDAHYGDLGAIYGKQWRGGTDQIKNVIKEIKTNPNSRRLIINSWNIQDIENMALPPCHNFFQFYVSKNGLSLLFNMRSSDVMLGLPYNIASYGLLLEIIAKEVNLKPNKLICNIGDSHIYLNHLQGTKELLANEVFDLPKLKILEKNYLDISEYEYEDFKIDNYQFGSKIKFKLST